VRTEPILATGPIVCKHFYDKEIPIISLDENSFQKLQTGQHVTVNATERVVIIHN
jgi:predicted aconitase with swiveling domain